MFKMIAFLIITLAGYMRNLAFYSHVESTSTTASYH